MDTNSVREIRCLNDVSGLADSIHVDRIGLVDGVMDRESPIQQYS